MKGECNTHDPGPAVCPHCGLPCAQEFRDLAVKVADAFHVETLERTADGYVKGYPVPAPVGEMNEQQSLYLWLSSQHP